MKIPKAIKRMILKPMISMGLEAYKQGKKDTEKGEYDEEGFKVEMRNIFDRNL